MNNSLNMISLFSGAGGMDYGFEAAGFKTKVAVEFDHDCCETLRTNRDWAVIEKDIHTVTSEEILETGGLAKGNVDLLIGGPPCQPFSKAGYWFKGGPKRLEDSRSDTLYAYMRCIRDTLPLVFVFENVHGINYSGKEEGFKLLQELAKEINAEKGTNYNLSWKVINTADYGVPQIRKRLFIVAHREGLEFKFPEPTHFPIEVINSSLQFEEMLPYTTAWDAIGNLIPSEPIETLNMRGRWAELLPSIPEGENYLWHTNRKGGLPLFGWRTRYWSFLLKLAKDKPSWTIQAQPGPSIGPFHWQNRILAKNELAAIQTFPKGIHFFGSRQSVQKQIGNAVPSLIAEILGRAIIEQFFHNMYLPNNPTLAVPFLRPIPEAEEISDVPDKFHHLLGEHPDYSAKT